MATDALSLNDVHAYYGDSHVLQGVSLAVPQGKILGLLGRNGVGKTTCISTIAGMVRARGGSSCGRRRIDALGASDPAPAWVWCRKDAHLRVLTVEENLRRAPGTRWTSTRSSTSFPGCANAAAAGRQAVRRRAADAGDRPGADGQPEVLLMDEPFEGLAPLIVAEVGRTIAGLRDEGMSILLVEQNVRLALELADHITILSAGRWRVQRRCGRGAVAARTD